MADVAGRGFADSFDFRRCGIEVLEIRFEAFVVLGLQEEEVNLLARRQVDLRMLLEHMVERGGAGFLRTDDQKVWLHVFSMRMRWLRGEISVKTCLNYNLSRAGMLAIRAVGWPSIYRKDTYEILTF